MLKIHSPTAFRSEREYVFDVLLRRFLGLDFTLEWHAAPHVELALDNRRLVVTDAFLNGAAWLTTQSMPRQPSTRFDARPLQPPPSVPEFIPVLYGDTSLELAPDRIRLGLDVFASSFFMLSRYEELVGLSRDRHDRFPAESSCAAKWGFLDLPIVNFYVEILWACIHRLWPQLERAPRRARTLVSCDVDWPLSPHLRGWPAAKLLGHYALRRRSLRATLRHVRDCVATRLVGRDADPFYRFDAYMRWAEEAGLRVAFYFIAGHTEEAFDGDYTMRDPIIQALLREIHARGHEIGLHPSYHTYRSPTRIADEFRELRETCSDLGITQAEWGGRQHYLRWHPSTFRHWATAGLSYDSTLTYAARAGFRSGVCYEYPAYDLEERKPLPLTVRPLVAMDGSLLGDQYMHLSHQEAASTLERLRNQCRAFNGDFTLLWHNSSLTAPEDEQLFRAFLTA